MADNLIFPVQFDLEGAVRKAQGDAEKYLRRLETTIRARPVEIDVKVGDPGSLDAIRSRIRELSREWNALAESERVAGAGSGEYTVRARAMIEEFGRLTVASESYARSLQAIASDSRRAAAETERMQKARLERDWNAAADEHRREQAREENRILAESARIKREAARQEAAQQQAVARSVAKRRRVVDILRAEENSVAAITAKLQHWQRVMNSSAMDGRQFGRAAQEVQRLSQKLSEAQARIERLTATTADAGERQGAAVRRVRGEYEVLDGYVSRLVKRLAVYASFSYAGQFLSGIREVTAQFELQRVSLGAIIQDQQKANALFAEIKSFALKSPVSILDLTKYTKQLAAYKIGVDELFETTKKLTDVSVGLGVSMDRVVLAYGQTRATGYLRASEIRQFTEMGVPIVEELATKLSKMNGELVTAAQVMDVVSKRGISFELVKEVFDDMTSAGGIFYNMQEKQGNTLFGLWAKLGDAASVMYDEIGNTDSVNEGMKAAIQSLTELMRNWNAVAKTVEVTVVPTAVFGLFSKYALSTMRKAAADAAATAAATAREAATQRLAAATQKGSADDIKAASAALRKAEADEMAAKRAASRVGLLKSGFKSLASTLATGLGIGAAIAFVTSFTYDLFKAWDNAHKLKNELKDIATENAVSQAQQVRQFEYLADKALNVALSDKERNDALQELHRTFKDVIPLESMSVENLRRMSEGAADAAHRYTSLTDALKEYIAEQNRQKAISAIQAEIQPKITKELGKMRDILKDKGFGATEQARFVSEMTTLFSDPDKIGRPVYDNVVEALRNAGIDGGEDLAERLVKGSGWDRFVRALNKVGFGVGGFFGLDPDKYAWIGNLPLGIMNWTADTEEHADNLADALKEMNALTEEQNRNYKEQERDLKAYKDEWERVQKAISDSRKSTITGSSQFLISQENKNNEIKEYIASLQATMGSYWDNGFAKVEETVGRSGERMSQIFFDKFNDPKKLARLPIDLQNYILTVQEAYYRLEPKDGLINAINRKFTSLATGVNANMGKMTKYLLSDGDRLNDKLKSLTESLDEVNGRIYQYTQQNEKVKSGQLGFIAKVPEEKIEELKNESKALALFIELLQEMVATQGGEGGRNPRSTRRQALLDEIGLVEKLYKEYVDMARLEGMSRAEADMRRLYADSLQELADKYGIELPRSVESFKAGVDVLIGKLRELRAEARNDGERRNIDIALREATYKRDKAGMDAAQRAVEDELKELAERISRTRTARDFYDKILGATGDYGLAGRVAESIFGQNGERLQKALADQVRGMTGDIELPDGIISADNVIDYKALRQFAEANKNELGKMYEELIKISNDGQRDLAKTYEGYLKDLEKAKSYSDKRIELARYTANQIAEINASTLPKEEKERLTAGYREREDKAATKLEWEAFKDMPMYVQMFADLDHTSTSTLENMKRRLIEMQGAWKNLDPTQLKEMQSRLAEIDEQLAKRNPFKMLASSMKEYRELREKHGSEGALGKEINVATDAYLQAKADLAAQLKSNPDDKDAVENLQKRVDLSEDELKQLQKIADAYAKVKKAIGLSLGEVFKLVGSLGDIAGGIGKLTEVFGGSEEDVQYWNDIAAGLNEVTSGIENMVQAAISGNPIGIVTSAITAIPNMISGFANLFSAGKIKRANKEIKRQQELLDQLEYTYGRLEKAADKLFGRDYLNNYNQQLQNLQAQQAAYEKQAQAERSKGKKEDKEKTQEYLDNARDTANKIKELQDDLATHFTGQNRTDAARQMAKSWVDARASMSDSFAAIKGDYQEMVKNMIVEGAAARVIENALSKVWNDMDAMLAKNDMQGAIDSLIGGMDSALNAANNGMEVLWKALEARGYDMKQLIGETDSEYTGIAKSVAGATSEEILQLSGFVNTALYYMAPIPRMDENLARVVALMEGRGASLPAASGSSAGGADYTDLFNTANEHLSSLPRMEQHLSEIHRMLGRIVVTRGGAFGVNAFLNGKI